MLFYVKRYLLLEIAVTLVLGGAAIWGIRAYEVSYSLEFSKRGVVLGFLGALWLGLWTGGVQQGYRVLKGQKYAEGLTSSLANQFENATPAQMLLGGLTAAFGEELFFRGFIQGAFGLVAGAVLFMIAHIGKQDIRIISYWSIFQGLYLGLFYLYSGNLLVPMLAHGLFDIGGMLYFRRFTQQQAEKSICES
ncbi:MAG: lysostaphin resistance A-like protein [Candidatus Korobacteraceae bacterium]